MIEATIEIILFLPRRGIPLNATFFCDCFAEAFDNHKAQREYSARLL